MKRLVAVTLALTAWIAGTLVGSFGAPVPAGATPFLAIGRAHAEQFPVTGTEEPIFVLLLGSDARPGTPMDQGLGDSIHILGINPTAKRATVYGIPRDSWVELSTGGMNKINAALPLGGVDAMIGTVENLTGITFDYYALTGFNGFSKAVNDVDGLEVDLPETVQGDDRTWEAGPQEMNGSDALHFARTRHYLPHGDFDRSLNQGLLMLAALENFKSDFKKDPATITDWLGAGFRNLQLDVTVDELTNLAFLGNVMKPQRVTNLVAYGGTATIDGKSTVQLDPGNTALWQDLAADGYILEKDIPTQALGYLAD
jgi:LCP family protein required for cell wall assembly